MAKKKQKRSQVDPTSGDYRAVLAAGLEEMWEQLAIVKARREELADGGFDPDIVDAAAKLMRVITAGAAEQRQQDKHERLDIKKMSPAEEERFLLSFIRGANQDTLSSVRALLGDMQSTSIL